ncbi:MAG: glutamate 5-kinase [Woeseia sp.]|nr:glutamate 5-kinase [Woeseia sp.]MBT8097832.1 glutamate 5-kinase [Woeseia sp.]NNE60582.1 glutamate 5-kinase [Woeseia sp.]NNL54859.1 glutamate 5-kinase [Woeseia sp.]
MKTDPLAQFARLVVKIGSSLLIDSEGALNRRWLAALLDDVVALRASGRQVLLVSSGSVALGCTLLGLNRHRARLDDLQAAAAAGQIQLAHAYQELLAQRGIVVAQILLTPDETEIRRRFLNARGTLQKLLDLGAIPVINENDTVATDELRYGDNDRLAARVASMVMADGLILLSDVDGLYSDDPRKNADAQHIDHVAKLGDDFVKMAKGSATAFGSGGMKTKLQAARIATRAGCTTLIASGADDHPLRALAAGARCTRIDPDGTPAAARKQWLAGLLDVNGALRLDNGAHDALRTGNSLLAVGIAGVKGDFRRGDAVTLALETGAEIGRGLVAYSSREISSICGCRSEEIASHLGYRGPAAVVHRDDLVLFNNA